MDGEVLENLDYKKISVYLRNRFPFLMIDRAELIIPQEKAVAYKNTTINEWFYQGHFPDEPIYPGVLQLESMFQTAALAVHTVKGNEDKKSYIAKVKNVVFHKNIVPGDIMRIEATICKYRRGIADAQGKVYSGGNLISEADFVLALPEVIVHVETERRM